MKLTDALTQLRLENPPPEPCPPSAGCAPDCCTGDCGQIKISDRVAHLVVETLGNERVDFGTFDNCREYGLTFTVPGWQFCVYEHRNSDEICVQGCPIELVEPYGPYGGIRDKWDVLASISYEQYETAARCLVAALRYVNEHPGAAREDVKAAIFEQVTA